jgi:PucR family transcriptional regulator, purine catabolism regulatory protein
VAVAVAGRRPEAVASALERAAPGRLAGTRQRAATLIALIEPRPGASAASVAEAVRSAVEGGPGAAAVSLGVAGPRRGSAGAHAAMIEAEHALALGRALHGDGATTHFEDLGPYCFVVGRPRSEIRGFVERVLGPLETDRERHEDLAQTLEAYLDAHGSLNEVARRLDLHRNTVRQRLRRIAEITRADLADADARLALQLAILGRRALDRLEAGAA